MQKWRLLDFQSLCSTSRVSSTLHTSALQLLSQLATLHLSKHTPNRELPLQPSNPTTPLSHPYFHYNLSQTKPIINSRELHFQNIFNRRFFPTSFSEIIRIWR